MIIFACEKCKYTDLLEELSEGPCPRCGSHMVSLGITSSEWNLMDETQKEARVNGIVKSTTSNEKEILEEEPEIDNTAIENIYITKKSEEGITKDNVITKRIKKVAPVKKTESFESRSSRRDTRRSYSYKTFMKSNKSRTMPSIKPGAVFVIVMITCVLFALRAQYNSKSVNLETNVQPNESIHRSNVDELSFKYNQYDEYEFKNCLYYDSLEEKDREIYQIAYDLVMHKDESGYERSILMDSFEYGGRENDFSPIIYAMLSDHPEFFYVQTNYRKFEIITTKRRGLCTVTFTLGEGGPNENEMITRFENATQEFLSDIDLSVSDPEKELQIHDKLINIVTYDYELLARDNNNGDLGYTAYGALVEDSMGVRNSAVCAGYARAFQYLLQQAGIEAACISGYADSESESLSEQGSHAWNIVKLDGEWYEVDSCWDDVYPPPDAPDKDLYNLIKYEQPQYFNFTHHWYNLTTDEMCTLPKGNTIIKVQQNNMIYEFGPRSKSTHQRKKEKTDDDEYEIFEYLNSYLPLATGKKYALKELD